MASVWVYWIDGGTTTGSTASSSATWGYWCDNVTSHTSSATFISAEDCWSYWTSGYVSYQAGGDVTLEAAPAPPETDEQREARLERERQRAEEDRLRAEQAHREFAEAQRKKAAAEVTAQELLEQLLTPEEFALYREHGRVLVKGRDADYLLTKGTGHIRRIQKGKVEDLCLHIRDKTEYAPSDNVIGMKLYIEAKEREFNQRAKNWGVKELDGREQEFLRAVGA